MLGKPQFFYSPTHGRLSQKSMTLEIAKFVNKDPDSFYRLVVGTDSQIKKLNGQADCNYVTAIIIHRTGNGAKYFWQKQRVVAPNVLRDRIYRETMISLEAASTIVPEIRKVIPASKYDLEIHIDVGPLGKTRDMIKEVVGMVNGNGFVAKTKPNSWGASSVADKYT